MKKLILILLPALIAGCVNAQKLKDSEVPAAVKAKFVSLYPNAKDVEWVKEDANYEVEFQLNKEEISIGLDASGNLLETENGINTSVLPAGVKSYFDKNMPGAKIKEAAKMTDANGVVAYEAEVKGEDYIFDAQGNFIKKNEKPKGKKQD